MRLGGTALAAAVALGAVVATSASAAPMNSAASATQQLTQSSVEKAQYKRNWKKRQRAHRGWHRHRSSRYRHWRRYHSRPYDWRTRGCVVIGPIWYCP